MVDSSGPTGPARRLAGVGCSGRRRGLRTHRLHLAGADRAGGERALHDRSSAPPIAPPAAAETIAAIERLRGNAGPAAHRRASAGRSRPSAPSCAGSGSAAERPGGEAAGIRYERRAAGELLHIDSKKLGRIGALGHRITGDRRSGRAGSAGSTARRDDDARAGLHRACRRARPTAPALAAPPPVASGVRIERVMTDNAAYTQAAPQATIAHLGAATSPRSLRPRTTARPSATRPRARMALRPPRQPQPRHRQPAGPLVQHHDRRRHTRTREKNLDRPAEASKDLDRRPGPAAPPGPGPRA